MPKIISPDSVKDAIMGRLDGKSRKETGEAVGISDTKVQQIWNEFRDKIGKANYDALSKIGEFANSKGLSFLEWGDEFCFRQSLERLGVKVDENLNGFVDNLYNYCIKNNLNPETVIDEVKNLKNLSVQSKVPIGKMSDYFAKLFSEIQQLEKEKKGLQDDISQLKDVSRKAKKESLDALEQKKVTVKQLNEYSQVKSGLDEDGFSLNDLPRLKNALANAKDHGWSGPKLYQCLSENTSLATQIQNQKSTIHANGIHIEKQNNMKTKQDIIIQKNSEIIKNQETRFNQLKKQDKRLSQAFEIRKKLYSDKVLKFEAFTENSLNKLQQEANRAFEKAISNAKLQQREFFSIQQTELSQLIEVLTQSISGVTLAVQNAASLKAIQPLYRLLCLKTTPLETIQAIMLPLDSFIIIYSNEPNHNPSTLTNAKNFQRSLQGDLKRQF